MKNIIKLLSKKPKYKKGKLDYRNINLKKTIQIDLKDEVIKDCIVFNYLKRKANPEVDFSKLKKIPSGELDLLSYFPKAKKKGSVALDLGCGNASYKERIEFAGFDYVGLDNSSPDATVLANMHSIPFKDNSIEFIFSRTVIQYSVCPIIVTKEVYRVLKKGSLFIGTVPFIESFHGGLYHHSHLGVYNSLRKGGFEVELIAPSIEWNGLMALSVMGLFPSLPKKIIKLLIFPLLFFHKIWWFLARALKPKATELNRNLYTTGTFIFIARKK